MTTPSVTRRHNAAGTTSTTSRTDDGPGWHRARPGRRRTRRSDVTPVTATRLIDASPARLWHMVTDVTRMGQWSPEAGPGRWVGRRHEPVVGARFIGTNRRRWRRWATTCRVVESVPGVVFAFEVSAGPFRISRWAYHFEHEVNRTRVIEVWTDRRGRIMRLLGRLLTGVGDRASHNRESMITTLNGLARAA